MSPNISHISSATAYRPELILFSAHNRTSLTWQIQHHNEYIQSHDVDASDLAFTRAMRREALDYRAFSILHTNQFINISSHVRAPLQRAAVVMVFSGQGAQWAGMGKDLTQLGAGVMEDVKRMDNALKKVKRPPSWTIKGTFASCISLEYN